MSKALVLALQCGVLANVDVLDAIVRVESAGNPYALAVNGEVELVRAPANAAEAVAMARWLLAHGYNFDAGLAQVNSTNFARLGLDAANVFDPCTNLRAASRVLEECHERARARWADGAGAWTAALSCYNTGGFTKGVRNGYAAAVRAAAASPLGEPGVRVTARADRPVPAADRTATRPPEVFIASAADAFQSGSREPAR